MPYNKNKLSSVIRKSLPERALDFSLTKSQTERINTIAGVVLAVVAAAGVVVLSAVAPNIFTVLKPLFAKKRLRFKKEKYRSVSQSFYYLKKSGLIKIRPTKKDFKIFITNLGRQKMTKLNLNTLTIQRHARWDGKWWQVPRISLLRITGGEPIC